MNEERMIKRNNLQLIIKKVGLSSTISNFINVLNVIWDNVFRTIKLDSYIKPRIRTCPGIISSIDTLYGINELCEIGDYADVYLLIRRLRDNLFLDLFLLEAQKNFEKIPSDAFRGVDLNNVDEVINALLKYNSACVDLETSNKELNAINKWKENKLLMSKDSDKGEFFQFHKYVSYLKDNNKDFSECYKAFLEELFSKMRQKLNDYVHSNSESVMKNNQKPVEVLIDIRETLIQLEHLFLVALFFVDSTLFSSEDYGYYIENGETPPEGSQYWINGYISEAFADIKSNNKDLFMFLIEHNNYCMNIDV